MNKTFVCVAQHIALDANECDSGPKVIQSNEAKSRSKSIRSRTKTTAPEFCTYSGKVQPWSHEELVCFKKKLHLDSLMGLDVR